ncbi:MAG: polyprenyl p-hydroxybenzoate/phenylacrylic acid decarboxylase [Deltaproteobacteria bacterium]|nr:polyprenyl p-hydroxybenzoate/phenylacrylic acid decarboxylase [Deltaproteobacteria bacterium]
MSKIIVGMSGATGVIYGVRMLKALFQCGVETHLVVTSSAIKNMLIETEYTMADLEPFACGSFQVDGMVIAPCSIKTLSAVANSFNYNLLIRAADVNLKERRRLVLLVRETPFHEGHLDLMMKVTRMGGVIMPPVPAFYHMPKTIEDIVDQSVGKVLDLFGIEASLFKRWGSNTKEEMKIVKNQKE